MLKDQQSLLDTVGRSAFLDVYQDFTAISDQSRLEGDEGLRFILLGLFGEVGSLLSALKKKRRDKDAYAAYADAVLEEFGDVLWYLANAARRCGLKLSVLASQSAVPDISGLTELSNALSRFGGSEASSSYAFEHKLVELAAKTGRLLDGFSASGGNEARLRAKLAEVFVALLHAAEDAGISLFTAASRNIEKTESRWPHERIWGAPFDLGFPADEQLERRMTFDFSERKTGNKTYVVLQMNGVNVGDALTDNRKLEDDYRFHDIFHIAHAAILGWSPTLRGMLKRKRKSDSKVDESEDGARAILIEEGVSSWLFNHAYKANFFRSTTVLDYNLLKTVREFVQGYEVEARPMWQWEMAILEGFRVFRQLKEHRGGRVVADLDRHALEFVQPL